MSTNHRTRIKSVADYSRNLTDVGGCCYPNADEPEEEYYNTCLDKGGHWQPYDNNISEISCPDLGATGCCCSCSYVDDFRSDDGFFNKYAPGVGICTNNSNDGSGNPFPCYQGGLENDVSFCECNAKGGVWAIGTDCAVYTESSGGEIPIGAHSLCTKNNTIDDVRWPGACCASVNCTDACSTKECMEDSQGLGIYSDITFLPDNFCSPLPAGNSYPGWGEDILVECAAVAGSGFEGENKNFEKDNRTGIWVLKQNFNKILESEIGAGSENKIYSSCVYLTKSSSYQMQCNMKTKTSCGELNGMWAGYDESNNPLTETDYVTENIKSFIKNKKRIPQSVVDDWNVGDRVLNLGRFIGKFYVKDDTTGIGVDCIGNELTGNSYTYRPNGKTKTKSSGKSFAIIIADDDYHYKRINPNGWSWETNPDRKHTKESSSWDSLYNDSYNYHLSLMKNINRLYKNPWIKWSPPSKDQLAFIYKQTSSLDFISNTTINDKSPNIKYSPMEQDNKVFYWSSSFLTDIDYGAKTQLAYCQSFGDDSMVVLSPRNKEQLVRCTTALEII